MFNLRSSTWPKSQLRADWAELVERERNRPLTQQEAAYKQREIERLTPILQKHGIIPTREAERAKGVAPSPPRRDEDRDR